MENKHRSEECFALVFAQLSDDARLDYFLKRSNVVYPEMPKSCALGRRNADAVLSNRFELIGETLQLEAGFSWKPQQMADKEWQIAHHKFYFAVDLIQAWRETNNRLYLKKWVSLIDSWLNEMDSGFITASDAQVEAKRIEHWVYSFCLLQGTDCQNDIPPDFLTRFLSRIASETDYITHHLKRERNHRSFQLFSVVLVAVLFPEFKLHDYFLKEGVEKLTQNLLTDILPDGVHVEQSSHYHQLVMETAVAFTEVSRLNKLELSKTFLDRLHAGLRFSMYLQWPTGEIPLFNDSDNGHHLALLKKGAELFDDDQLLWAGTLGRQGKAPESASTHFETSGYFILGDHWGRDADSYQNRQHIFYDCGRLGEGSHSHYDLFNFTYFVGGQAAIIDPGRYTYDSRPDNNGMDWRHYFKGTACHNTVSIDGKDQTRYISREERKRKGLREKHGPAVEVLNKAFHIGKTSDWITAQAKSAAYLPLHTRHFIYMAHGYVFIFDQIDMVDDAPHRLDLHFHLTDALQGKVKLEQQGTALCLKSDLIEIRSDAQAGITASITHGWVSKKYGIKTRAPILKLSQTRSIAAFFASTVSASEKTKAGIQITSLQQLTHPSRTFRQYKVEGIGKIGPFSDTFFFQLTDEQDGLESDALQFRAHFLAYRKNAEGRVIHVVGQNVSELIIEGRQILPPSEIHNVEAKHIEKHVEKCVEWTAEKR